MKIDVENIDRSQMFFDENIFKPFYVSLKDISRISLIRFLAPAVGVSDGLINAAETIAGLAEAFFKGVINIFGSMLSESYSAERGLLQIGGGLFIATLSLPIISVKTVKTTLKFFQSPKNCTSYELERINKLINSRKLTYSVV